MSVTNCSDDFIMIDTLPSPVLIDIDKPPTYQKRRVLDKSPVYQKKKGILLSDDRMSFKKPSSHKSTLSHFNPDFNNGKYSCHEIMNSKSAFRCKSGIAKDRHLKGNEKQTSPIVIDIEDEKEPELKIETENKNVLSPSVKLKNKKLPSDMYHVKDSQIININKKQPVLIELDVSDQEDEVGVSNSKERYSSSSMLSPYSESNKVRKLKKKSKKSKRKSKQTDTDEEGVSNFKETISSSSILSLYSADQIKKLKQKVKQKLKRKSSDTDSDDPSIIPVFSNSKETVSSSIMSSLYSESDKVKKLHQKNKQILKRKSSDTDTDDPSIIPVFSISKETVSSSSMLSLFSESDKVKKLKKKSKISKRKSTQTDTDEESVSNSKETISSSSILSLYSADEIKKLKQKVKQKLKIKSIETDSDDPSIIPVFSNSNETISNSSSMLTQCSKSDKLKKSKKSKKKFRKKSVQTYNDYPDIIPVGEVTNSASCKGYLSLNVAKDMKYFSNHLEKSKTYVQKRNFNTGKTLLRKCSSKEYEGDTSSSTTPDICTELDCDHSLEKDDINSKAELKDTVSRNINEKTETDINDNESSSLIENAEMLGCPITESSLQNEINDETASVTTSKEDESNDQDIEEFDNYEAVGMDTDAESGDNAVIDIENTNADYIPLSSIKINDLEYCPPISDEILNKRKNLETLRRWELTGLGNEMVQMNKKQNGTMFTLLSYNVLSQQLLWDNEYLYKNCDKKFLEWSYRWPLLQQEIRHLEPDLMAFQEIEGTHYHTHYHPWFKYLGYNCIYKKKTGTKVDGCLIVYNAKKFEVLEENSVEYLQPKGKKHLDRDNVGLIAKFTPTSFYSPFCVATTHLLFNPKRHDVRLAQMAIFLTELDRICYIKEENKSPKYCPVILTGDFNSEPHSPLLKFVKSGSINYSNATWGSALIPSALGISEYCQHKSLSQGRYLQNLRGELFSLNDKRKIEETLIKITHSERDKDETTTSNTESTCERDSGIINHGFKFKSVYYPHLFRLPGTKGVTTHQDRWVTVDYIFYSKILKNGKCIEGDLKLIARYGLLGENEAKMVGPLPSDVCPSDHFPLAAQFFLKKI